VKSLLKVIKKGNSIKALAHITGGGFTENIPRVLPKGTVAQINLDAVPFPAVFKWLQTEGGVAQTEMLRTFNCGIGMIVVVAAKDAKATMAALKRSGETAVSLGTIAKRKGKEPQVVYTGALG
jgi:phosphoribosylformylglycinamidine cyclo-ligase